MRLSKIKLAGFKSFVDPTNIELPGNLLAVVGPNGCGKSNVIDAVRWVMGESSAKHLRGDSMADVIFNGSSARKPVGSATIELVFDNSDGSIGGQYASYSELSVRRLLSRDGTSQYFLNNVRCRRKDITGIFLGTGLGPRSYAIIEQGMISRLIEARPEEMRVYLEEAAGISRYKERRRETENRIRHTRDNLDRLNDLREEIDKQLRHLQRQADVAEKYKTYKAEQRRSEAELLALRLRDLDARAAAENRLQLERQTALESRVADQRSVENEIEKQRELHAQRSDDAQQVQERYYSVGAEIARLEQRIAHEREMRRRHEEDLQQTDAALADLREHIDRDAGALEDLERALAQLEPDLQRARESEVRSAGAMEETEQAMSRWRERWEAETGQLQQARQAAQVEQTRIEHLASELGSARARRERVGEERSSLAVGGLEEELRGLGEQEARQRGVREDLRERLDRTREDIGTQREQEQELAARLNDDRAELQRLGGRIASLEALQQAALGQKETAVTEWLAASPLAGRPRLGQRLQVEAGWERAVETVLGDYLEAICVDAVDAVSGVLGDLPDASMSFVAGTPGAGDPAPQSLASRVRGDFAGHSLLRDVLVTESLPEALALRATLGPRQSVITRDGLWLGADWLRVKRDGDPHAGVLAREGEIRSLRDAHEELAATVADRERRQRETAEGLRTLEQQREELQSEYNRVTQVQAGLQAQLEERQAQITRITERIQRLEEDSRELDGQIAGAEQAIGLAHQRRDAAEASAGELEGRCASLESDRDRLVAAVEHARDRVRTDRETAHRLALEVETRRSTRSTASGGLERMQAQCEQLMARRGELGERLEAGEAPLQEQGEHLNGLLEQRVGVEQELLAARHAVEAIDVELRRLDEKRLGHQRLVQQAREELDTVRMAAQELRVRRETVAEQFAQTGFELGAIQADLAADASIDAWEERLAQLERRIQRLGPINLAAIDEYREQSERKEYLDSQFEDLTEALETLENAIAKIDRETRSRFRETFERVDAQFRELFTRLFGGGTAYLELTGDDLLSSGVAVMARPPGKRNSTIHLLSGGEKALTAVALVFAIFELNPAPFCLLDEVDAPLDDANVGRFCDIVRAMSERVQFVVITHNKTTMEMAGQLMGVTMQEPGVSRLVAVDVDEAVQMAAM